ncbi:MAG TPA: hypothetical protein VJ878_04350 [Candidatus Izemoplasmatales bacterium]|nr:hypothetical protein [Candidatus Izemoplasmatales bacterium]
MSKLEGLYPFMAAEKLKALALKIMDREVEGIKLYTLFPFLEKKDLNEVIRTLIETKDGFNLKRAIPFMTSDMMDEVFEVVQKGGIEALSEEHFYPFLSKDKLKSLFETYVEEASIKE